MNRFMESLLNHGFGLRYFNKDFRFKDHVSTYSLFPEPMFYSASNKEIAMEMIRGKWDERKYSQKTRFNNHKRAILARGS